MKPLVALCVAVCLSAAVGCSRPQAPLATHALTASPEVTATPEVGVGSVPSVVRDEWIPFGLGSIPKPAQHARAIELFMPVARRPVDLWDVADRTSGPFEIDFAIISDGRAIGDYDYRKGAGGYHLDGVGASGAWIEQIRRAQRVAAAAAGPDVETEVVAAGNAWLLVFRKGTGPAQGVFFAAQEPQRPGAKSYAIPVEYHVFDTGSVFRELDAMALFR